MFVLDSGGTPASALQVGRQVRQLAPNPARSSSTSPLDSGGAQLPARFQPVGVQTKWETAWSLVVVVPRKGGSGLLDFGWRGSP